jgi:hypothetical protein
VGTFSFAVRATDNARSAVTSQFRIIVNLPTVPPINISGLPATADAAHQFGLQIGPAAPFPATISGQAILTFSQTWEAATGRFNSRPAAPRRNLRFPPAAPAQASRHRSPCKPVP